MSESYLKVKNDFSKDLQKIIQSFKKDIVLVGIPESGTDRKKDPEPQELINNATIMAINEFGSPQNNIPPRPVFKIGINKVKKSIADQLGNIVKQSFVKSPSELQTYYDRVGFTASISIKKIINSQIGILPPAESTLAERRRKKFKGTKALIVTAQLRNSITYAINKNYGSN